MNKKRLEQKLEESYKKYKELKSNPENPQFQITKKWLIMYNMEYITRYGEPYRYQEHRGQEQFN